MTNKYQPHVVCIILLLVTGCGGSGGGGNSPTEPPVIVDSTPPVITLNGATELAQYIKSDYVEEGASAVDDRDGNVNVTISSDLDVNSAGTYTITYTARDAAGNSATATRTVVVIGQRLANQTCTPPEPTSTTVGTVSFEASFSSLPQIGSPLAMVQPPSDSSFWLLAARDGRIVRMNNDANTSQYDVVLDISAQVSTFFEMGLTGLAIHPNYPQDNRIYVVYNDDRNNRRSTVSSFAINTATGLIDPASEIVQLFLPQPEGNHNGGDIAFGNDGLLYISFGDGGFDRNESQDLSTLHGAILRLNVNEANYSIPSDNPFNTGQSLCDSGSRVSGQCPEIYAYGFRNPWRFSVDQLTGEIWVADVGQSTFEEVNRITSGGNYGWPIMEANQCFLNTGCDTTGLELPVTQYPRSAGVSTVGGYVYRGDNSPSLAGQYVWGDTFSSQFFTIPANAPVGSDYTEIFNSSRIIAAMAQGNDGEIYLLNLQGDPGDEIYRVTATGGTTRTDMPSDLSDTGCFNTTDKTYPQGVINYQSISTLWSDGAEKDRAFAIPDAEVITVNPDGDFIYPDNSILIKHFLAGDSYLETRLFVNLPGGWQGFSYEWNDQQTDAVLLTEGKTKDVGDFVHTYPSQSQCAVCHTAAANHSLGLEIAQLNRIGPIATNNQLELYSDIGLVNQTIDVATAPTLYAIDDTSATLEQRARSYLHSNCSSCHRPGAQADFIDLRYDIDFTATNLCDEVPSNGDLGITNARRIAPGDPDRSVLYLRMLALDGNRMPPLASLVVDDVASSVVQQWISGISSCN